MPAPSIDKICAPALPPAAAKEAVKDQLIAAARRATMHALRLISHASSIVTSMAVSREDLKRLPAPPKASPSMCVQLRLLDGQVITQMMVSLHIRPFMQKSMKTCLMASAASAAMPFVTCNLLLRLDFLCLAQAEMSHHLLAFRFFRGGLHCLDT